MKPTVGQSAILSVWPDRLVLAALTLVTATALLWLLRMSRYGFDFTDESFYLIWAMQPGSYAFSASQFGFVYHPLHQLLQGNVAMLRQANVLITWALAWCLCQLWLGSSRGEDGTPSMAPLLRYIISAALACGAWMIFGRWLVTPSYNSLTFQAILIVCIGLVLAGHDSTRRSLAGWLAIALGGVLAFLAKPTTAGLLAAAVPLCLWIQRKLTPSRVLGAIALTVILWLAAAWWINGSVVDFVHRLQRGFAATELMSGGHSVGSLFRWDNIILTPKEKGLFVALFGSTVISSVAFNSIHRGARFLAGLAILGICLLTLGLATGMLSPRLPMHGFRGLQMAAVGLGVLVAGLVVQWRSPERTRLTGDQMALAAFLALCPYLYAFGTNTHYGKVASTVGVFWAMAGFLVVRLSAPGAWRLLVPGVALVQLVAVSSLYNAMHTPYRQSQELITFRDTVGLGPAGGAVWMSPDSAQYIGQMRTLAAASGWQAGMPMLDLTGHYPGTLYALGADVVGAAWLLGGYPGSSNFAQYMLDAVSCESLARAWLLVEPKGPRQLSTDLPAGYGMDIARDFVVVGSVTAPTGEYEQTLYHSILRPLRPLPDAVGACEDAKHQRTGSKL